MLDRRQLINSGKFNLFQVGSDSIHSLVVPASDYRVWSWHLKIIRSDLATAIYIRIHILYDCYRSMHSTGASRIVISLLRGRFFFCFRQRLGGALSFTSWVCHKSNATDRGGYKFRAGDWLSYQEAVKQSTKMLRMTSISCNCVNCIPKMRNLVGLTMDQLKMSNKAYKCTVWIALNGYINKDCALFAGILGKIQSPILTAHIPYLEKPSLIIQFSTYSNLTWAMRFIKQNYTQHGVFAEEIC